MSGTAFGASSTTFTPVCFRLSSGRERDKQGYGAKNPGRRWWNAFCFADDRHKRLPTISSAAVRRRAWSVAPTAMHETSRADDNGGDP
jgi:hypothetical protein